MHEVNASFFNQSLNLINWSSAPSDAADVTLLMLSSAAPQ
jgi:hypothetical protein